MKISNNETNNQPAVPGQKAPEQPKQPKQGHSILTIIAVAAIVTLGLGLYFVQRAKSNASNEAKTEQVSKKKPVKKVEAKPKEEVQSSSVAKPVTKANTVDMKPLISKYLIAYQIYTIGKKSSAARAQEMSLYATTEGVESIFPPSDRHDEQASIPAVYTLQKPVEVSKNTGDDVTYTAVISYQVKVAATTNSYVDSYSITAQNNKITNARLTGSAMK